MNGDLDVHIVGHRETAVDRAGSSPPVFVKLEAARPGLDLLNQSGRLARIALAKNAKINGKRVGRLQHALNVPRSGRAGGGRRTSRGSSPAADHGGNARIKCLFDILRT